jgi:tetratricopeptide (TPR) repeat protein
VDPADRLARQAAQPAEAAAPERMDAVSPPLWIAPDVLAPRGDDIRARRSLEAALSELSPPIEAAPTDAAALPPEARDEAFRLYLRGRDALMQGRLLVALTELDKAHTLDPGRVEILHELAAAYDRQGNRERAMELYRTALVRAPFDRISLLSVGLQAAEGGRHEEAVDLLGRIVSGSSGPLGRVDATLAYYTLHVALIRLGYDQAAIEAGRTVLEQSPPPALDSFRAVYAAAVLRRSGEVCRALGDAHCRLGEYDAAHDAYLAAAARAVTDPIGLQVRAAYTHLRAGRPAAARYQLYRALADSDGGTSPRLVSLCRWIARARPDDGTFAESVGALAADRPSSPGLILAHAALLDGAAAIEVLEDGLRRWPRDLDLAAALLEACAAVDPQRAIDRAGALLRQSPERSEAYVDRLVRALPDLVPVIESAGRGDPASDEVAARVLARYWLLARAWQVCAAGRTRHPDDAGLRRLELELAGALDEPYLVERALAIQPGSTTITNWIIRTRALRAVERFDEAVVAAERAVAVATEPDQSAMARVELARAYRALAMATEDGEKRRDAFLSAVRVAESVIADMPEDEEAYRFLLTLYGPTSPFSSPRQFERLVERVRGGFEGGALLYRIRAEGSANANRVRSARDFALLWYGEDPTDVSALRQLSPSWESFAPSDLEAWLRDRIATRPGDPNTLDQLVRVLLAREDVEGATALAASADARPGDFRGRRLRELIAQVSGDVQREFELGDARLRERPAGSRRSLQRASLAMRAGEIDQATASLGWLVDNAEISDLRHLVGAAALCTQLPEGARADALTGAMVVAIDAHHDGLALPIYAVGLRALARQGDLDRFDALARRAAERHRDVADGSLRGALRWRDLAQRLVDDGRPSAAGRALRASLGSDTVLATDAMSLIASMAVISDAASDESAGETVDLILELEARGALPALGISEGEPTLASVFMDASQGYTLIGNEPGAERLLREALRLRPDHPMVMNNLAYALIDGGREEAEAARWAELAYSIAPNDANILDTIAWLRYKQGAVDDAAGSPGAIALLERAIDASGADVSPEVLDHYGDALWRAGRADAATDVWQRVEQMLHDPAFRTRTVRAMTVIQSQGWGLLVADPDELYDRNYGALLEKVQSKLERADQGEEPPVAPQFGSAPSGPDGTASPSP